MNSAAAIDYTAKRETNFFNGNKLSKSGDNKPKWCPTRNRLVLALVPPTQSSSRRGTTIKLLGMIQYILSLKETKHFRKNLNLYRNIIFLH